MRFNFLPLILLTFLVVPVISFASPAIITVSTQPVYHPGQTVFIEGTTSPNSLVGVTIYNPSGSVIYSNTTTSSSTGAYQLKAFTFPSSPTGPYQYGTYTVHVGTSQGLTNSTTFQFQPLLSTVTVIVVNPQGTPVSGAIVQANSAQNVTNGSGIATLLLPSGTYTLRVVPPSPYATAEENITVTAPQPLTVKVTVQVQALILSVDKVVSPNVNLQNVQSGTGITMLGGTTLTVYTTVTYLGQPVSGATVTATYNGTTYTAQYMNGNYVFNVTVNNVQYESDLQIVATYAGMNSNQVTLPLTVNLNEQAAISKTLSSLNASLISLTNTVNSLTNTVNSLTQKLSSLNASITSLQSSVQTLNSEYSSLSGRVGSISGTVDIALAVSVIAIIIAIVVLILLFRKVS
ncbi:carboxypeptidase regulatory-like domain-containing protein [Metallosphaera sp.]|uniref:carboxypeptidase regulatory-like domain-containing protein n=1 Tax=Metallosphaera sp. TaxID=2020860 RepID=UPI003169A58F